ncbi:MAG: HlyC/CorC family transporter [Candidatus Latescibacterota bacterium]|nr:MAG: HlyC/CorC family transporter [Candidatus Latescibacterota bacterium]
MNPEIDLVLLVLSAVLFGVFSGTYSAIELLAYGHSERNGDENTQNGKFVDHLLEKPVANYLSLGLGRVLFLALLIIVSYRFATQHFFTESLLSPGLLAFVALVLLLPLLMAKLIALRDPERFTEITKFVTYPVIYVLRPFVYVGVLVLRRLSPDLLNALSFPVLPFKKRIELYGYKEGEEETDEQQLVSSVFDFGDTKVREVMVPRIDMVAVDLHTPGPDVVRTIVEAGHSRIPVYDESIDRIVGVVHTKDVLQKIVAGGVFSLGDLVRDVYFVPESKMIDELLSEFQKRRIHIAIVVDEYGGTAGMVTLEDVLEELVGDIQDEFDTEEELVKVLDGDNVVCNARVRLDELHETLGLDLEEGDVDTLGGFLFGLIGRVPRVGEVFEHEGIEFEIVSVVRQRIDKVHIKGLSSVRKRPDDVVG